MIPVVPNDPLPPSDSPFDPALWVKDAQGNVGYLGAKSHTYPERFLTWWAYLGQAYSTSLHELAECSEPAAIWLRGFLRGSAPDAWFDDPDFEYAEDDPRTQLWWQAVEEYQLTGTWSERGRTCEVCGAALRPSAPVGLRCDDHGGATRSCWPVIKPNSAD